MLISKKRFLKRCGSDLTYWVKPNSIHLYRLGRYPVTQTVYNKFTSITGNWSVLHQIEKLLVHDRFEPFNVPEFFLKNLKLVETEPKFRKVKNAIENREHITSSAWYKSLMKSIDEQGVAVHKDIKMYSKADVSRFFTTYFFDIVDSMKKDGYRLDRLDDPSDLTAVKIGANGELIKSSGGSHRLFISQILELPSIPVKLNGVHEQVIKKLGIRIPHFHIATITEEINRIMRTHA